MAKSPTPLRTSPRKSTSKYASTPAGKARVVGKKKIRRRLIKKVSKSAVDLSPADDDEVVGKKNSNINEEFAVVKRGKVAKRQKQKGTVAARSGGNKKRPGKPKEDEQHLDDGSDEVLEDHDEEEEEDDDDHDNYEGQEEEDDEEDDEESQEAVVEDSFESSSADEDPDIVIDHEHDRLADVGGKRKRGNWAGLSATDHAVVALRQTSHPTSHTVVAGGASSIPTSNTVGGTTDAALSVAHLDRLINVRGMSRTESMRNRQKHVADRVRIYVKDYVFRRIKFINSDLMFQKAIKLVMDHEAVPLHQRGKFQMLYESVFNEALNTKRSSCEQAGGKIVRESIATFREQGEEEFFSIDELCKLRRATTERERKAFFWFFGSFLECVCGRKGWGKQKQLALVSEATDKETHVKLVTKSDEAFALLLFDNYIEKWEKLESKSKDNASEGENKRPRQRGKYTGKKSGHCKYGGWSRDGTARFNELYNLVQEDRSCQQAKQMETELLAFCRKEMNLVAAQDEGGGGGGAAAMVVEQEAMPLEAAWDLDDEDHVVPL